MSKLVFYGEDIDDRDGTMINIVFRLPSRVFWDIQFRTQGDEFIVISQRKVPFYDIMEVVSDLADILKVLASYDLHIKDKITLEKGPILSVDTEQKNIILNSKEYLKDMKPICFNF